MVSDGTGVRMSAAVLGGSDMANNGSDGRWFCGYCERSFGTKIGLGVHKSRAHPNEVNDERQVYQRPSRGTGQRNAISSRSHWTESEITTLVKLDLDLLTANPSMSAAARNKELAKQLPGRTADAIKGRRKDARFASTLAKIMSTNRVASQTNNTLNPTVRVTSVRSTAPLPQPHPVDEVSIVLQARDIAASQEIITIPTTPSSQTQTITMNGEINSLVTTQSDILDNVELETNVSTSATSPQTDSSISIDNTTVNRDDEVSGSTTLGNANVSRIEETRLNYVDYQLLAKLKDDSLLYARHIRRDVRVLFNVEQLLNVFDMNRGDPTANTLLEEWLEKTINMDGNAARMEANKRRKPNIRKGYGSGKGLRGKKRAAERAYLQHIYERSGVRGIAQHVLRDVEYGDNPPTGNSEPSAESMMDFWSDVFGTAIRGKYDAKSVSDEDSDANCLWGVINQEDVKRTELGKKKAKGPDGISVKTWRSIPRAVRALFYNGVLYHGVVLESLSAARTIFIPKVANPSKPGEYRPISITSVIQRQLHKIFVDRLNKVRKFDDRQVAFRNGVDGVSNNLATLRTIIEVRKRTLRNLHIILLDLKKAFDSVSHDAVFRTMSDLKCPTLFVNYLKLLYSSAKTSLELSNGESKAIRIGRGVFQGDPLSPIIFNHIIDRALSKLNDDMGYPCGEDQVTSTAFADDITVIGDSIVGTQSNINILVDELAKYGLQANPSKCLSLSIMTEKYRKVKFLDTKDKFTINGEHIKSIGPSTQWKYLGINWTGEKIDKQLPDIRPKLNRVNDALLKPQQKLEIITKVILPAVFHQAILGNASQEELTSIDTHVRKTVREIMHFPHDIPNAYIHAPVKCGGMGVPELLIRIPLLRYKRMRRFADSDAPVATQFDRSIAYRHNAERVKKFLRENEMIEEDHGVEVVIPYYLAQLEHYFATKGLTEAFHSRHSRNWCNKWSNELSGGDFIKYHLISSCSLPTLARRSWGRPDQDIRCRHGCGSPETIHHVQQECILTKGGRSFRHDRALNLIHNAIVRKFGESFSVEKEPQLQTSHGLRKPDLILHGGDAAVVIDLNIVGRQSMGDARRNKVAKYRDLPGFTKVVQQRYSVDLVEFHAITISYCGIIERGSRDVLQTLDFNSMDIFRITTSVLRGSWLNWFQFKKNHQQRFFDSRMKHG